MSEVRECNTQGSHTAMSWDDPQEVWLMVEGLDALEGAEHRKADGKAEPVLRKECDWCGEVSSNGYFVAVRDQNYQVCSICWGRSPDYVDFRREGASHEEACRRLTGNRGAAVVLS